MQSALIWLLAAFVSTSNAGVIQLRVPSNGQTLVLQSVELGVVPHGMHLLAPEVALAYRPGNSRHAS